MHSDSLFHVDLSAIAQNASMFARLVGPEAVCCGVVKADAYGLGARPVAETLRGAGMPLVAVFRVEEALDLLSLPERGQILVLGVVRSLCPMHPLVPGLADGCVELVVHDKHQLREIAVLAAGQSIAIRVHVKVDTGMGRGGCGPHEAAELIQLVLQTPGVALAGVMTHFTSAGTNADATTEQAALFTRILNGVQLPAGCRVHLAATAATVRDRAYHHGMVRIGLGLVGCIPGSESLANAWAGQLIPAVRWVSALSHVRSIQAGQPVGYGQTWRASQDTTIGIIPIGYADGIPRQAGSSQTDTGASIAILQPDGKTVAGHVPVIGLVSMDQIAVDLGGIDGGSDIEPGRAIEVLSATQEGPSSLRGFAAACGLSPHQVLVGINPRVRRVHARVQEVASSHESWQSATAG
jgi:alanine racemase